MDENIDKYNDIIKIPHPRSKHRNPMSMSCRAAQFAPFAALTAHSRAISEVEKQYEEDND